MSDISVRYQTGAPQHLETRFAARAAGMLPSEIRSLFAVASKPPIAAAATIGTDTVSICFSATSGTATDLILSDSILTLSYLSGHATTPGADAYVSYWYMPVSWRYLT